ncbi:MAG: response regulator [Minicystis sp.]
MHPIDSLHLCVPGPRRARGIVAAEPMTISRVLVVDDEPHLRRIGELCLRSIGQMTVSLAASGAEAVEVAATERPDVILLDVMMPGMDGPTTLGELRARPETADIPVIFMTAKVQKHEVERYLRLGAAGVIGKPFESAHPRRRDPPHLRGHDVSAEARARMEAALRDLRAEYTRDLPAAIDRLAGAAQRAREDAAAIAQAAAEAHRIHGTAGSLALGAISEAAGRAEEALDRLADGARDDGATWAVVDGAVAELFALARG